jgi:hypothetical protein
MRVARIVPQNKKDAIIQYFDFVWIWPPDSIIESSNISDLVPARECYLTLDTDAFRIVP